MLSRHWRVGSVRLAQPGAPPGPVESAAALSSPVGQSAAQPLVVAYNPVRQAAFLFGLGFLFVELTVLHELAPIMLGFNTYLLYLIVPPALFCGLLTGSVQRTFRNRASWYWLAFYAWMILATPFSTWQGGSFARVVDSRISLMMLIVVGGLATTWKEVRGIFYTIAGAAVVNLLTARLFMKTDEGRLSVGLTGFDIANSNDLAAQLLLVLPFALYLALGPGRNILVRLGVTATLGYGVWIILQTASRGALVAMGAMFLIFILLGSARQRIIVIAAGGLIAIATLALLPGQTLARLGSLFGEHYEEADESEASRMYLFQKSLLYTVQHPIFGVGPDQFSNFEGGTAVASGQIGSWHATHCAWTQVSSECGIPAMIFYIAGVVSAIRVVVRMRRAARDHGHTDIANACFCYLLGMTGFLVAITFLANAYRYYVPAMIGLAVTMATAEPQVSSPSGKVGS